MVYYDLYSVYRKKKTKKNEPQVALQDPDNPPQEKPSSKSLNLVSSRTWIVRCIVQASWTAAREKV
jgi:hypothetical protein